MASPRPRTADPYRDLDVIDARAPRTNQAVIGVLALVALLAGWPWLVALLALQLAVGLTFGRRYCLPCLLYFEVLQPRLGEGPLEDSRPPRFANLVGVTFLGAATVLFVAGVPLAGWVLTGMVAALALLAAATGICVGCQMYLLLQRLRGSRPAREIPDRIAPEAFGLDPDGGPAVVVFTSPYCLACQHWLEALDTRGVPYLRFSVRDHGALAHAHGVRSTPVVLAVEPGGRVVAAFEGEVSPGALDRVAAVVRAPVAA